ncbi:peptidoglycan DD-metalloendopeptidase family protein [Novosphingobium sp. FSY-8]|uniref:Peptidoglycan DD-metalloendopeptidase family protein n=1 Tax=Novosphingobium ovatum TaxID=1908523 RepID=A0ABW9XHA9_9SPHN|nr:peptidoglycan DD-metalloendopeptidase family protein [Novosphingobium ovatum]
MAEARAQADSAGRRATTLEAQAAQSAAAADRTAHEVAALAARIQQAEAVIAISEQNIRLIAAQRADLRARMAQRQKPLVRLTAALQSLSRRPPVLSLMRPGSVRDAVHSRAVLEAILPEVQRRTAGLRAEIARAAALEQQARAAETTLKTQQRDLTSRRQALTAMEVQQRMAARRDSGSADREAERSLAMAEKARDLSELLGQLEEAGQLRAQLAQLPGPVMRPARPDESQVTATAEPTTSLDRLPGFVLPVNGRLISGFGGGGNATRGIVIATRAGAQAVSPAGGRVVFADAYAGYGQIVIVEHASGYTSVITGLARLDVRVGDVLVAGGPLGVAGPGRPTLALELRKDGNPVNPMDQLSTP